MQICGVRSITIGNIGFVAWVAEFIDPNKTLFHSIYSNTLFKEEFNNTILETSNVSVDYVSLQFNILFYFECICHWETHTNIISQLSFFYEYN